MRTPLPARARARTLDEIELAESAAAGEPPYPPGRRGKWPPPFRGVPPRAESDRPGEAQFFVAAAEPAPEIEALNLGLSLLAQQANSFKSWGGNDGAQLGDGTVINRPSPVDVQAIGDVVATSAGVYHSLALKPDGTVWAWGSNSIGQLGDGTFTDRALPVQVTGLTDVIAIAAGGYFNLAVKTDGSVWAWGENTFGALGTTTGICNTPSGQIPCSATPCARGEQVLGA